jgi:xylulose-5-phosphate/fructose-6-phosphate phosphoketolase
MTIEVIDEPNPRALPSHIPDSADDLSVHLKLEKLPGNELESLRQARKAADYIAAGLSAPSGETEILIKPHR